tara:strand:+ start:1799 stop:2305 length:507 start_codon:yes stop_codon:yes gene_type:complete
MTDKKQTEIIDEPVENEAADRNSRNKDTRKASTRPVQWRPANKLYAPDAPDGFVHRWIRAETLGQEDKSNVHRRMQEGFELVRADEYPDSDLPVADGKHSGVIGLGGLLLARFPEELREQRNKYYRDRSGQQMEAVDNDWMKDNNPLMPKDAPERRSQVSFGQPRNNK